MANDENGVNAVNRSLTMILTLLLVLFAALPAGRVFALSENAAETPFFWKNAPEDGSPTVIPQLADGALHLYLPACASLKNRWIR